MLSAFKNFFVTFLIAALIFGSGAYFAVRFLTDTISGIFDMEASELEQILNPEGETAAPSPSDTSPTDPDSVTPPEEEEIEGTSFNMLFIVTDFQPDIFNDYLPDSQQLTDMEAGTEPLTGILGTQYRRPRACAVLLLRADLERQEFTLTPFPSITRVTTTVGDVPMADLYNLYGHSYILSAVSSMTGLTIDHYLLVNITELSDIVAELGGVSLYLSHDLYYNGQISTTVKPTAEEADVLPLLYSIGKNEIDGPGAVALMMNENYSAGVSDRNSFLVTFFTEILKKLVEKPEAEFTAFYDSICERALVETTFTPKDLVAQMELIRAFVRDDFKVSTVDYPGRYVAATEESAAYYEANTSAGLKLFKTYRPHEKTNTSAAH